MQKEGAGKYKLFCSMNKVQAAKVPTAAKYPLPQR